jgi:eukaryotic-like serine/threonine-protein kinase
MSSGVPPMYSLLTFGRLSLERDRVDVPGFDAHRQWLAILAVIAAEGSVSRDRLMALLWPESDTVRARGSLKQALHQIRHLLGAPDLVQGDATLSLNPAWIESDVLRFATALERGDLRAAVAFYTGPFLDGVHLGGGPELDYWVEAQRGDLARRHAGALEHLATEAEGRGDYVGAVGWWRMLKNVDPSDDRVALRLMQALGASGQRAAALQHAEDHERLLREGWDLAADPAVTGFAERLRAELPPQLAHPGEELREAAGLPSEMAKGPPALRPVRRTLLAAGAVLGAAVLVLGGLRWFRPAAGAPADSDLIAIAPFQVLDPTLSLWHEGIPDILSRELDGAGPLRTVPQSVAIRASTDRADRAAADVLGSRTGAGLVVFGSVGRLGLDSVVLRAVLLDRAAGTTADVEVRGEERRIGEMTDSLSMGLLGALGRNRTIAATRRASVAGRSLPALREFLRGEQFYRRGLYDSALAHYDLAIGHDPAFALALRRMGWVIGWAGATAQSYQSQEEYGRRLEKLKLELGPRDSLLFLSESLLGVVDGASDPDTLVAALLGAKAVLEVGALRYANDPEIWYELGELRYHFPAPAGAAPDSALDAFDRAIALDPGFSPSYDHAVDLALRLGDRTRAWRYADAGGAIQAGEVTSAMRFTTLILDSGITSRAAAAAIRTANANTLFRSGAELLFWSTDPDEVAIALLRELSTGSHDPAGGGAFVTKPAYRVRFLAAALAFRGRLRESAVQLNTVSTDRLNAVRQFPPDPFLDLALFGALPDSQARTAFVRAFDRDASWDGLVLYAPQRHLNGLPWWSARDDTTAIVAMAARAGAVARGPGPPVARLRGRYFHAAAGAWLALARHDSIGAARLLQAIPDTLCLVAVCFYEKVALARLLAVRGEYSQAAALLDRWSTTAGSSPSAVLAALDRARIAERLGDPETARARYRFVMEAWRNADVPLQRYVSEARAALARLGVAPPRGPTTRR